QNRLSHFATLIWAAVKLRFLFSFVDRKAEIFLFNDFSVFTTFVLAGIFRRKGLDIKWVETLPWLKTEASPKELVASRGEGFGEYLNILSAIVGERIVEAQHRPREAKISDAGAPCQVTAVGYALAEPLPEKKIALLSWPEIKQKFGLQDFSPREKAVLMIETPLYYTFPKVDMRGTYTRVAAYLNTVLEPGVKIHFKLHYSNPGNNHFAGTIVEDRLKLLPHSVPAELYVMGYDRVYFFMSSSVLSPTRARLFSLSQLIEFEDEKERKRYFATYDVIFGGHPQHIEMITDKSVEA
ncbi:MAG: hypothetical protein QF619_11625, partial [Candidatus Binatia bacterium]|nr:hypothetical protein [Candidatus Binatia bacterium]